MHAALTRILCRLLAVCLIGLPLQASAGLIGTDAAVDAAAARVQRDRLTTFLDRADVARRLEAYGLTSASAAERVAALSDAEVASLAREVDGAPAGGTSVGVAVVIGLVVLIVWTFYTTRPKS